MSGIAKAVKKVWRPIEKLGSKLTNIATFGLHNKWKKTRHKIIKSKAFRIVVAAAAIYFGGAALLSMAGGGTASAGIGSAWAGAQGAGSAVMAGNFSGAASALGTGFTGGAAAGAAGTFAGGQAMTQAAIAGNAAAAGGAAGAAATTGAATGAAPSSAALTNTLNTGLLEGVGSAGLSNGALTAGAANTATTAGVTAGSNAAASGGLLSGAWNGLGEAGKAAVITSGVNMAGQMIQGHAAEKAAEEERERRTYWGVDGAGRTAQNQPNLGNLNYATSAPTGYTQPPQWQPKTLDDLINETRNRTNANSGLLWG